jgi:hypothetical protein
MTGTPPQHTRGARLIALAALVVLAAGVVTAMTQWRAPRAATQRSEAAVPPASETDEGAVEETGDVPDVAIEQALRQQPLVESSPGKIRWVDAVPGIDDSDLGPRQREVFIRFANAERCTCGCGYTLAGCRIYDATCETSLPLLVALHDSVRAGQITSAAGIRPIPRHPASATVTPSSAAVDR